MRNIKALLSLILVLSLWLSAPEAAGVESNVQDIAQVNTVELKNLDGASVNRNCFVIGTLLGLSLLVAGLYISRNEKNSAHDK